MSTARQLLATGLMGLLGATALMGGDASAQQVYRIVGPDGRVTFSDQPPQEAANAKAVPVARGAAGSDGPALPLELRQAASRFPVTLYTSSNCEPCSSGRTSLASRGIPYTEKTISNPQDLDALKRLQGGSPSLPMLTVGGQQLKGYNAAEWNQFLDAAGYPKTSVLPPNYRAPLPSPLVAVQGAPATPAEGTSAQAPAPAAPAVPPPPADNPAGIRF